MRYEVDVRRVRGVVFDLGGVFLAGSLENALAFGTNNGLSGSAWGAVRRALFIDDDHPWGRVERGELSLEAFAHELIAQFAAYGVALPLETARNFMGNSLDSRRENLRHEIVDACRTLRDSHRTALLTNNIVEWRPAWRAVLDTRALFDLVVDSSEVGMRKPEEGIYRLVEGGLGLMGDALLLVDDQGVNLKGAKKLGWQTLKYDDTARVLAVLNEVAASGTPYRPS